jgi:polyhydroxybutyrate depolymerase
VGKKILKVLMVLIGLILASAAGLFLVYYLEIHRTNGEVETAGQKRSYLLYVSKNYQAGKPVPLVISIHGYAEWPAHQMELSHWNQLADEYGFLVVYPLGNQIPPRWMTNGKAAAGVDPLQDVKFISDLIDQLEKEYTIDPRRIYANGLSNGGGMSFMLACKLSGRIAATGGVSGAYMLPWEACTQTRPVPVMLFHGTDDPIVPFQGGPSASFQVPFPAIPEWVKALAAHNSCAADPVDLPAAGEVTGVRYKACAQDAEVVFYTIAGGGHSWPGGQELPKFIVGNTSQSVDATRLLWEFFQQHPLEE